MKVKSVVVITFLFILVSLVFPGQVSLDEARVVAENWTVCLRSDFNDHVSISSGEPVIRKETVVAYVFHLMPKGYIIISAEDYLPPIKMYSLTNNFGEEGQQLEELVFSHHKKIIDKVATGTIDPANTFVRNRRDFFLLSSGYFIDRASVSAVEEVAPLIQTTWYQLEPYNLMCPVMDGERAVTGCVATAFAQVMNYYEHPQAGQGSWSYTTDTYDYPVSADFNHAYNWGAMLNDYPEANSGTIEQQNAVALLMSDVGAAVCMDYSPEGSGASPYWAVDHFPFFFDYSRNIMCVERMWMNAAQWFQLAKAQIDHGTPVPFGISREGGAHMVVIDGYRISNGATSFHINLGWGGSWDGYYSLDNIVVRDNLAYTLLEPQCFILNMVPEGTPSASSPQELGGTAHGNRSLFFDEYIGEITFMGVPNGMGISNYRVLEYDIMNDWGIPVAEVSHTGQSTPYRCLFRVSDYDSRGYLVIATDYNGIHYALLYCNLVLQ